MFVVSERAIPYSLPVLLTLGTGVEATALFQTALKMVLLPVSFFTALSAALYPTLARLDSRRDGDFDAVLGLALRGSVTFALGWSALFILSGPAIIEWVFGSAFTPAAPLLLLLLPYLVLSALWQMSLYALTATGDERMVRDASLLSALLAAVTVLLLAPGLGAVAAPLALALALSGALGLAPVPLRQASGRPRGPTPLARTPADHDSQHARRCWIAKTRRGAGPGARRDRGGPSRSHLPGRRIPGRRAAPRVVAPRRAAACTHESNVMNAPAHGFTSAHARAGLGRENLLAAALAGLVGVAFLASAQMVLLIGAVAAGVLFLSVGAQRLAIGRATALFLVFVFLMVSFGRDFSYLHIDAGVLPLYVTELVLGILLIASLHRWLQHRLATDGLWHAASLLLAAYIILGLARLPVALGGYGREAVRDAVVCTYALFAFLTAWLLPSRREIHLFGMFVVVGSVLASGSIVLNAVYGEGTPTSTPGVVRYGAGIQAFSATFTALIWTALLTTGRLSRRQAVGGGLLVATQSLVSLLLVQHRSQLLALIAGVVVIALANPHRRRIGSLGLTVAVGVALLALLAAIGVLPIGGHPLWEATVERAASSFDPAADSSTDWRVQVNRHVLSEVLAKPLTGIGFGPAIAFRYSNGREEVVDPHNSFVAVLYRLGFPTALLLFTSLGLLSRRAWVAGQSADREKLSLLLSAQAGLVAMAVFASFNVVLEGPYLGLFFWIPVGILMRLTSRPAGGEA